MSFFLLDDLVDEDLAVKFFMNFDDFRGPAIPRDLATYQEYQRRSLDFVHARNDRIAQRGLRRGDDLRTSAN